MTLLIVKIIYDVKIGKVYFSPVIKSQTDIFMSVGQSDSGVTRGEGHVMASSRSGGEGKVKTAEGFFITFHLLDTHQARYIVAVNLECETNMEYVEM